MSAFMGDFLGFTLGNIHSSQLNITRVSSGDRYTENLTPNFTDSTAVVPGGVGTYYWNTSYTQKPFIIDFAFDDLRAEDIRRLKQIFGFNGIKELIFDETPYKKYYVKCSSPPTLKYLPFGQFNDVIIYKGEGTINLVAYYPYAVSTNEIKIGSGVNTLIDNIGDIELPCRFYFPIDNDNEKTIIIKKVINGVEKPLLKILKIKRQHIDDTHICVDMKLHLIEGINYNQESNTYTKTGRLYNQFISEGDFFLLPIGQTQLTSTITWTMIKYNFLYY